MSKVTVTVDGSTITTTPRNDPHRTGQENITVNPKTFVNFNVENTSPNDEGFSITHETTKAGDNLTLELPNGDAWMLVVAGATGSPMQLQGAKEGSQTIDYDGTPLGPGPTTAKTFKIVNNSKSDVSIMLSTTLTGGGGTSTVGVQSPKAGGQKSIDLATPDDDPTFVIRSKQSGDDR